MQPASTGAQMAAAASAKTAHKLHEVAAQWLLEGQVPDPAHLAVSDMRHEHKQPMWKAGQQVQRCGRKRPTQLRHALSASRAPRCQWRLQARDKTPCEMKHTGKRPSDDAKSSRGQRSKQCALSRVRIRKL